jgi:hypothetical protein
MHRPLADSDVYGRALIALILVPVICATPSAAAEIFKCTAKDGTPLYQNFPCQFDSMGWVPSSPVTAKPTAASPGGTPPRLKAAPVDVGSTVKPADPREVRIGMTSDEVRAILGEPLEIVQDQPIEGIEIWRYVDRTIQLDRTHRVAAAESW